MNGADENGFNQALLNAVIRQRDEALNRLAQAQANLAVLRRPARSDSPEAGNVDAVAAGEGR